MWKNVTLRSMFAAGDQEGQYTPNDRVKLTVLSHECPIIQTAEQRSESGFVELHYKFQESRNDMWFSLAPVNFNSLQKEQTHIFETSRRFHVHAETIEEH